MGVGEMDNEGASSALLFQQLKFQHRWQALSMTGYIITTVGMLICTTSAGLSAAFKYNEAAAILAGISTLLISIEKSLLFREKWKFHLLMHTRLKILHIDTASQNLDEAEIGRRLSEIIQVYASELPVQSRE